MRNGFRVPHRMTVAEFQGWEPPDQLAQRRNVDGTWPPEPLLLKGDAEFGLDSIGLRLKLRDAYRTSSLVERLV